VRLAVTVETMDGHPSWVTTRDETGELRRCWISVSNRFSDLP